MKPKPNRKKRRGPALMNRKKVCRACVDETVRIDYKHVDLLQQFVTERGKIVPRRISGACARHQRALTEAIRRARHVALLPYATVQSSAA